MSESWKTKFTRWRFNLIPAYFGTGARIAYLAEDFRELHLTLALNWQTRNYVGTTFGGSMYGAVDPIYMLMLIKNLGPGYIVWDKAATIHFKKPGKDTLYAKFNLSAQELDAIKDELSRARAIERQYTVDLTDATGTIHAHVEKTIYIRKHQKLSSQQ